ncbi:MAG: AAA family ATPase [Bacteroidetes bacterium]|nr:AAA family ATPase [Bacteroidota bacterium]
MKKTSAPRSLKKQNLNHSLPVEKLRWRCNPNSLGVTSTKDIAPTDAIIGQERALRALSLGLEMRSFGYNIYVAGYSGTGRMTTIKRLLKNYSEQPTELRDHCLLYNFEKPEQPIAVSLPAGEGKMLRDNLYDFITDLLRDIPAMFESQRFQQARKSTLLVFQERQKTVMQDFQKHVHQRGFEMVNIQIGNIVRPDVAPLIDNKPATLEEIEQAVQSGKISEDQQKEIQTKLYELQDEMATAFRELRHIDRMTRESMKELEQKYLLPLVEEGISLLKSQHPHDSLQPYFELVKLSVADNFSRFNKKAGDTPSDEEQEEDDFLEYQVNILVDNSEMKTVPVIIESNPKHQNLFGVIERKLRQGNVWFSDFMHIKSGSLLRADGGFIVLNALDILIEPGVWYDLKRTLRTQRLDIQSQETQFGISGTSLKPESFKLNVKVILIGDMEIYYLLYFRDEDFKKIFKVRADFDSVIPRSEETIQHYLNFVSTICENENFLPFNAGALAQVIEFGVHLAGHQKKISTHFTTVADIVRESHYWASKENAKEVQDKHVDKAIEERRFRVKLSEDKLQEMILQNSIMIATEGSVVGQVNGLSVYDVGEYAFGKPTRITARTSVGNTGIINIEREAQLSGPTHTKGIAILSGFLSGRFAQNKPFGINASVAFEQSYGGVDGDSASSTEIYAILSSLADVPIRQEIAVTGSVNQQGDIQPIGGVNLKIEGFFDVCRDRGLTGTQGVIIPQQNVQDLMLREDVCRAVEEKKFHIYAISHIDEGIEILTGMKAGKQRKDFSFEPRTINSRVDKKLMQFAKEWKKYNQ